MLQYSTEKQDDAMVLRLTGRLDATTAPQFEQECEKRILTGETHLVVDFTEVSYISSAGLRSILTTAKRLKKNQGTIAVCGLQGMVEEVFTVSGFSAYLPVFASVDEVLAGAC